MENTGTDVYVHKGSTELDLGGVVGVCGIPDWNWLGCSWTCPLGGQEEGLDLEMCSGRGVGR